MSHELRTPLTSVIGYSEMLLDEGIAGPLTAEQREAGVAQGRNTPDQVPRIAQVLADLRGVSVEEVRQVTTRNVQQVLGLGGDCLKVFFGKFPELATIPPLQPLPPNSRK